MARLLLMGLRFLVFLRRFSFSIFFLLVFCVPCYGCMYVIFF